MQGLLGPSSEARVWQNLTRGVIAWESECFATYVEDVNYLSSKLPHFSACGDKTKRNTDLYVISQSCYLESAVIPWQTDLRGTTSKLLIAVSSVWSLIVNRSSVVRK